MFPVLSASANYKSLNYYSGKRKKSQYYDGGIYDNSGLSTIRDVYAVLAPLRDMISPEKKIIILSAQNSTSIDNKISSHSLGTLISAITGSIFSANTKKHNIKLENKNKKFKDELHTLKLNKSIVLNRWISKSHADTMRHKIDSIFEADNVENYFKKSKNERESSTSLKTNIYFDFNESDLNQTKESILKNLINDIKPYKITLKGYTDSVGSENQNKIVASKRMNSVRKYIENQLKDKEIIIDTIPKLMMGNKNDSDESRQLFRRVEIIFNYYESKNGYFPEPLPSSN